MTLPAEFRAITVALQRHSQFLLACHERADGDALGSLLGLGLSLRSLGKSAIMYSPGGVPDLYRFLPQKQQIIASLRGLTPQEVEVVICLDCDGLPRAGDLSQWLKPEKPGPLLIDIDHHEPEKGFGDIRLILPQAAATAILVYHLLVELKVPISQEVATCLLTGLYLDTGSLRYDNTNEEVLRIATTLATLGAQPSFVARGLYETKSLPALRLLGRALSGASVAANGKIIFALLTAQDFQESGAQRDDTEGIIDLLRSERDASVAALFIQQDGHQVKVSLRSKGEVDVAAVASRHGGGGHARASGFTLPGPLEKAAPTIIDEVTALLR